MNNESTAAIRDIITDQGDKLAIAEARARYAESEVARLEAEKAEIIAAVRKSITAFRLISGMTKWDSERRAIILPMIEFSEATLSKYEPPA